MRRRFISLSEAVKTYGSEKVDYFAPRFEKDGQCPWCGGEVKNKRRRFCSDDCRHWFENVTVWNRGRDPYSLRIIYRDNFTCQDCGEFRAMINEHGMTIPIDNGLEVHHILPVSEGGSDDPANLITLCKECHRKRHSQIRIDNLKERGKTK